ncbi:hypothetical protein [Streptomyces colonosanans]|nr:hypothetical protein [Streptomyces colonosanans]
MTTAAHEPLGDGVPRSRAVGPGTSVVLCTALMLLCGREKATA